MHSCGQSKLMYGSMYMHLQVIYFLIIPADDGFTHNGHIMYVGQLQTISK
jgi:hypothetical protein